MRKIFIITQTYVSDEGVFDTVVAATFDEDAAKARVEDETRKNVKKSELSDEIFTAFVEAYNAIPSRDHEFLEMPRWEAGLGQSDITEDMRLEREAIARINGTIAISVQTELDRVRNEVAEKIAAKFDLTVEEVLEVYARNSDYDSLSFSYEEIEFIECE